MDEILNPIATFERILSVSMHSQKRKMGTKLTLVLLNTSLILESFGKMSTMTTTCHSVLSAKLKC